MTLIYELELNILMLFLHTNNEGSGLRLSRAKAQIGQTETCRQTDPTERITVRNYCRGYM